MTEDNYDLIVIGAGPGGYVCAIRGAQLGLKTAIVEKDRFLGGTCLNVGCIPSKALLHSTEMFHFAKNQSDSHGIKIGEVSIDLDTLMKRKDGIVATLRKGVEMLVRKRGIQVLQGLGEIVEPGSVRVTGPHGSETYRSRNIVIATGSKVAELPGIEIDGHRIVSSDDAIAFDQIPDSLVVVGGGAIGLELGSVWARLGTEVAIVEFLPRIAPTFDEEISVLAERIFRKQGIRIETSAKVSGLEESSDGVTVTVEREDERFQIETEKVLVAVGRSPSTDGLGLKEVGIQTNDRGFVVTDESLRTNVEGIYAIGDAVEGPMLAHKAEEEGIAVAETLTGHHGAVNYDALPNVIYTNPEIASVGITETMAEEGGITVATGEFPLAANGRAIASGVTDGIVKVIVKKETDRILGVQILAHNASELIASAVAHIEYGGSAEDIARTIHAHPTLSESLKEAALAVSNSTIHSL